VAFVHAVEGEWHDTHADPKCCAGALWQRAQLEEEGCDVFHVLPTV
jgi:hypothetical protein